MRIANATNGLCFPPYDEVSMFLSTHGHHYDIGYFRMDAMPYSVVIHLLKGGEITMIDATPSSSKLLPSAFRNGLTTWCLVFNRAIRCRDIKVAEWETYHHRIAAYSHRHKPVVQRIRRLAEIYGVARPVIIGDNIKLEIHRSFEPDDKLDEIRELVLV